MKIHWFLNDTLSSRILISLSGNLILSRCVMLMLRLYSFGQGFAISSQCFVYLKRSANNEVIIAVYAQNLPVRTGLGKGATYTHTNDLTVLLWSSGWSHGRTADRSFPLHAEDPRFNPPPLSSNVSDNGWCKRPPPKTRTPATSQSRWCGFW